MVALQIVLLVHEFNRLFLGVVHGDIARRRDFGVVPLVLLHGDQLDSLRDRVIHRRQSGGLRVTYREKCVCVCVCACASVCVRVCACK